MATVVVLIMLVCKGKHGWFGLKVHTAVYCIIQLLSEPSHSTLLIRPVPYSTPKVARRLANVQYSTARYSHEHNTTFESL